MEKIKQNPKKIFGVIAGVLIIVAIILMVLPGLAINTKGGETGSASVSLFSLAFGGKINLVGAEELGDIVFKTIVCPLNLISFIFLILSIVIVGVLVFGLFTEKFGKKTLIILSVATIVLLIVSAILVFASKQAALNATIEGMTRSAFAEAGEEVPEEWIQEFIKIQHELIDAALKDGSVSISLGAGAIVSPIMMLLGAGSLGGVICLSAKE